MDKKFVLTKKKIKSDRQLVVHIYIQTSKGEIKESKLNAANRY